MAWCAIGENIFLDDPEAPCDVELMNQEANKLAQQWAAVGVVQKIMFLLQMERYIVICTMLCGHEY